MSEQEQHDEKKKPDPEKWPDDREKIMIDCTAKIIKAIPEAIAEWAQGSKRERMESGPCFTYGKEIAAPGFGFRVMLSRGSHHEFACKEYYAESAGIIAEFSVPAPTRTDTEMPKMWRSHCEIERVTFVSQQAKAILGLDASAYDGLPSIKEFGSITRDESDAIILALRRACS